MLALLLTACGSTDRETGVAPDSAQADPVEAVAVVVHDEVATVLVVTWTQVVPASAWLSWELDGETWTSPARAREPGAARDVVLGLPADTTVPLTLHVEVDGVVTVLDLGETTTGSLPPYLVPPSLIAWDPVAASPEPFVLTSVNVGSTNFFGPCYVVILDRQARVVWYRWVTDSRLTWFPRVSRLGGHITWDASTVYSSGEPSITRATLDLAQEEERVVPGMGLVYDELDDGSFLYDYAESGTAFHLHRLRPDGSDARVWSCFPWIEAYTTDYWGCATNTVQWNPDTDTVLWSMFRTSTVVEIDLETGSIVRQLGQLRGGWAFDPAEVGLELQHFPNWSPDGTLVLSTHVPGSPGVQVVRELALDDATETATQVWSWSPTGGEWAEYVGEAQRLAGGNTLVQFGTDGEIQEVTPDGTVAWNVDWNDHLVGHLTPVADLYALNGGW